MHPFQSKPNDESGRKFAKLGNAKIKSVITIVTTILLVLFVSSVGVSASQNSSNAAKITTSTETTTSYVCCETTVETSTLSTATVTSTAAPRVQSTEQILTCDVTGSCFDTIYTAPSAVDCAVTFTADTNFVGSSDYILSQFVPTPTQALHELPPQFYVAQGGDVAGYTFTGSANQVDIYFSDSDGASMSLYYQLTAVCPSS